MAEGGGDGLGDLSCQLRLARYETEKDVHESDDGDNKWQQVVGRWGEDVEGDREGDRFGRRFGEM